MKRYTLDGMSILNFQGFLAEFGKMINGDGGYFGKDLESFDDCLFGGYGMDIPCEIIWNNSDFSKIHLGHDVFYLWCQESIDKGKYPDEDGLSFLKEAQKRAGQNMGSTMFDEIVNRITSVERRSGGKVKIRLVLD